LIGSPRFGIPLGGEPNIDGLIRSGARPRPLSQGQRKRLKLYLKLAIQQHGIRCSEGYLVSCWWCQWWLPMSWATVEHLVNRRDGGTGMMGNLRLVHWRCNQRRNARDQSLRRARLLLIAGALASEEAWSA